jgi:large subunit ribosomal protein L4
MPKVTVYSTEGESTGREIDLPDPVFADEINEGVVHAAVLAYEINQSKARSTTKTRSQVRGGGRKPWRQKGTGRARQGSIRAPHWAGGGVVFGPDGRTTRRHLPKRMKRIAIRSMLSARAGEGRIMAIEPLALEKPSTKGMAQALAAMDLTGTKVCVILAEHRPDTYKSLRNIGGITVRVAPSFCAYDLVSSDVVVIEEPAVKIVADTFGSAPNRGRDKGLGGAE